MSQGLGRPLIGLASDKYGRINIAGLGTLMACLTCLFLWIFAGKTYRGLIVYALFGMFSGVIWPCVAPVGAEVVGLQLLPSALSIYMLGLVLPATLYVDKPLCRSRSVRTLHLVRMLTARFNSAEVIALFLKNPGGNGYINVQIFTGVMYLGAFTSSKPISCAPFSPAHAILTFH